MSNQTSYVTQQKKTVGDLAVDGLLTGMAGRRRLEEESA